MEFVKHRGSRGYVLSTFLSLPSEQPSPADQAVLAKEPELLDACGDFPGQGPPQT